MEWNKKVQNQVDKGGGPFKKEKLRDGCKHILIG